MSEHDADRLAGISLCRHEANIAAMYAARSRTEEEPVPQPTDAERITEACERARQDRADGIDPHLVLDDLLAAVELAATRLIAEVTEAEPEPAAELRAMPNVSTYWPPRSAT
jgi:hypothetical protein